MSKIDIGTRAGLLASLAEDSCADVTCPARTEDCYAGQWTIHGPHHFEVTRQKWMGGGVEVIHCPGKTEATKL